LLGVDGWTLVRFELTAQQSTSTPLINNQLVSSSLMSPFSTNMDISETKRAGVESYPYPAKEGQQYINLNQQPPKKKK